jgi:phage gp36-like protein
MSYNTKDDILGEVSEDVLMQLTDDNNLGVVDDDKVAKALARADGEVDGYCGKRYQVPFDPVSEFIKALALDISVYNLYCRRENVPEIRKTRHENALKNLVLIAKGTVTLGIPDTTPAPTAFSSAAPAVLSGGDRQFSRKSLKGF